MEPQQLIELRQAIRSDVINCLASNNQEIAGLKLVMETFVAEQRIYNVRFERTAKVVLGNGERGLCSRVDTLEDNDAEEEKEDDDKFLSFKYVREKFSVPVFMLIVFMLIEYVFKLF